MASTLSEGNYSSSSRKNTIANLEGDENSRDEEADDSVSHKKKHPIGSDPQNGLELPGLRGDLALTEPRYWGLFSRRKAAFSRPGATSPASGDGRLAGFRSQGRHF